MQRSNSWRNSRLKFERSAYDLIQSSDEGEDLLSNMAAASDVTVRVPGIHAPARTVSSDSSDQPTFVAGMHAYGDKTARYLDDPQSYFASLETDDNIKCVASTVLFLIVIVFLLLMMFIYNPQM